MRGQAGTSGSAAGMRERAGSTDPSNRRETWLAFDVVHDKVHGVVRIDVVNDKVHDVVESVPHGFS